MDISLAVGVFQRTEKLRKLLQTVDTSVISAVHIADDGDTETRTDLYNNSIDTPLYVHDLPYDSGIGAVRACLATEVTSEYMLCVDCDHKIPPNVEILYKQIKTEPSLGGVAGNVIEPRRGRLWQSAKDFVEAGETLRREADVKNKEIETVAGYPLIRFDFVPQAFMLRRSCLDDYSWDEQYENTGEHLDFFLGHWKQTSWDFAVCPSVNFPHYPGGNQEYLSNRHNDEKKSRSRAYLRQKWGYNHIQSRRPYWLDSSRNYTLTSRIRRTYEQEGATGVAQKAVQFARSQIN